MSYQAVDIANFYINLANNISDEDMTNIKVNKMIYFAQAWSLLRLKRPLFEEDIEAWPLGPVVPNVYQTFKPCGRERIRDVSDDSYSEDIFSTEDLELLIDVAREYGQYTAGRLVDITHESGDPWKITMDENKKIIDKEIIKQCFSKKRMLPRFEADEAALETIGYRDEEGTLVLPYKYYCPEDDIYDEVQ